MATQQSPEHTSQSHSFAPGSTVSDPGSDDARGLVVKNRPYTAGEKQLDGQSLAEYNQEKGFDISPEDPVIAVLFIDELNQYLPGWERHTPRELYEKASNDYWGLDPFDYPVSRLEEADPARIKPFNPDTFTVDDSTADYTVAITALDSGFKWHENYSKASGYGVWVKETDRHVIHHEMSLWQERQIKRGNAPFGLNNESAQLALAIKTALEAIATDVSMPANKEDRPTIHIAVDDPTHAEDFSDTSSPYPPRSVQMAQDYITYLASDRIRTEYILDDPRITSMNTFTHLMRERGDLAETLRDTGRREQMQFKSQSTPGLSLVKDKYEFDNYQLACSGPFFQNQGICKHQLTALSKSHRMDGKPEVHLNDSQIW